MQETILYCQTWDFRLLSLSLQGIACLKDLVCIISARTGVPLPFLRLVQANKPITALHDLHPDYTLHITLGLNGGKGGFGSLLRSMNPKKKQVDNFESCRDLSGRRLRNGLNEQRIEEWKQRQEEEEKFVEKELHEYEKSKNEL